MYDFDTGHFTSESYVDLLRLAGRTGLDAHRKKYNTKKESDTRNISGSLSKRDEEISKHNLLVVSNHTRCLVHPNSVHMKNEK